MKYEAKRITLFMLAAALLLFALVPNIYSLDYPHNAASGISCGNCHWVTGGSAPAWITQGVTPDDTINNNRCLQCHDSITAPAVVTHSAYSTGSTKWDGEWRAECVDCHNPHYQRQHRRWGAEAYRSTGTVASIGEYNAAENETVITLSAALGTEYEGYYIVPNTTYRSFSYKIKDSTQGQTQITVKGPVNMDFAGSNETFAIVYAKNITDNLSYTNPDGATRSVSTKLFSRSGFGDDADNHTSSARICESCHSQTSYHRYDTTGQSEKAHNNNVDCVQQCHLHNAGFKASCNACHNAPPATGKHAVHFGTGSVAYGNTALQSTTAAYGFSCGICHNGAHLNTSGNPHTVEVAFGGIATQGLSSGSPSYAPSSNAVDDPGAGWTFNYSDGTCSNVYCHGNYFGSGKNTAVTFNSGSAPCGSCHNASNTTTPASGKHDKHASSSSYEFKCTLCHKDIVGGTSPASYTITDRSRHVNGYVDYNFDPADPRVAGGTYSIATGTAAPSNGTAPRAFGSCSNIYCHSNVQPEGGAGGPSGYSNPLWDSAGAAACGSCHAGGHGAPLGTGSHTAHLNYTLTTTADFYKCGICHKWNMGSSLNSCGNCHDFALFPPYPRHANYQIDMIFDPTFGVPTYNGSFTPGNGYSSCSNTYCHSNGTSVSTGAIPANTTPNWGSGSLACNSCHGYPPAYASGSPKANTHSKHTGVSCNNCHYTTTSNGTSIASKTTHVNKQYTVDPGIGRTFSYAFAASGGTCSNISCHFGGTATWGGTIACGSCHAATAETLTTGSHRTHLSSAVLRGPNGVSTTVTCDTCHGAGASSGSHSGHGNGTVAFGDGAALSGTTSCDACHSPGGDYDGVNDAAIGAKNNWQSGIYDGSDLAAGKEKWCATCHDGSPSAIQSVNAPNVVGEESGAFTYGSGWGFYKTGHGLPSSETYPASGGVTAGANQGCSACHDLSTAHVDGNARTYDDHESAATDPSEYRSGYRLKQVPMGLGTGTSTQEPMLVPWPVNTANSANNYRLCVTCHDSGPFTDSGNMNTNMVTASINRHQFHLVQNTWQYPADWSGSNTSRITCVNCHNVHGSTRLAMVRDGKLTSREPGLEIWYKNDAITSNIGYPYPPVPADLPLSASDGTAWIPLSATNLCAGCHGSPNLEGKDRTPFQNIAQAPTLTWTGETGYLSDGVNPDSGPSGGSFAFRVEYTDTNNDAPASINLLVDANNDGAADATYALTGTDIGDVNYMNGKIYSRTLSLTNTGSSIIGYKFEASDGTFVATGSSTNWSSLVLGSQFNQPPALTWVSDACRYQGVSPLSAVSGANFEFRVLYTDADNNAPSFIEVWVDSNDNGTYEAGEKYAMDLAGGGDGDFTNGETYTKTITLSYAGDGMFNYRFVASDGTNAATGNPVTVQSLTVMDTGLSMKTVCGSGCDYTTIQTALDNTPQTGTVLVYPGTYGNIQLTNSGSGNQIDQGKTVRSVCGPDVTTISGGTQAVYISNVTDITVDGFGIIGATWGVYLNTAAATVNNSRIHDNVNNNVFPSNGGAGVYTTNAASTLALSNSEIYSNTADNGAGIFLNGGTNPVISNSVIRNNTARASGGGVFLQAGVVATFTDTAIRDNMAASYAGGVYFNGASADFFRCSLIGNVASTNIGGFAYMVNSASTADFENCVIADNRGTQGGALYMTNTGQVNIINSTVANNQATGGNGGAFYNLSTDMTFRNSILWGNRASGSGHNAYFNSGSMTITDSLIASGNDGIYTNAPYFEAVYGVAYTLGISGYMSDNDPMFVDVAAGNYHIQDISDAADHAGAAYAPDLDMDGDSRPQGAADDIGADEYLTPAGRPVLSWTGETGYTADGADPDNIVSGSNVTFRVDYTSAAGLAPAVIQVWVDRDDNGAYSAVEKFNLSETDSGDTNYTDGKRYSLTLSLNAVSDGSVNYRFYATDGPLEAIGAPLSGGLVTVLPPLPAAPTIGVPTALSATSMRWYFTDNELIYEEGFKLLDSSETVKVEAATPNLAYLDEGGLTANTQYTRHVKAYNVTGDSASSASAAGYTLSATPNVTSDKTVSTWYSTTSVVFTNAAGFDSGGVQYYRYAWDQNAVYTFNDTESQWSSGTLTRTATATGSWYLHVKAYNAANVANGTQDYGPYYYDGTAPSASSLGPINGATGVDLSSNLTFTLADSNSGVNWSTFQITLSGNEGYSKTYLYDSARVTKTGTPASYDVTVDPDEDFDGDEVITVTIAAADSAGNAMTAPEWSFTTAGGVLYCDVPSVSYPTIQSGIDAAPGACTVVRVASGTYSERINFNGKLITVKSVSGAAVTKIQGNNTNNPVVIFSSSETAASVLDGFTIDNQYTTASTLDRGIYISNSAAPTVRNCIIQGNKLGTGADGAGIYINGGSATLVNTTLGGDAANTNTCRNGCGLYATALSAPLSITTGTVSYNAGTYGGGIYLNATGQTTTVSNTAISNNSVSLHGAAIYSNSPLVISGGSISSNTSTQDGGGIYLTGASATTSIAGTSLTGNTGRNGGAIFATGSGELSISNSTINANTAATQYGAGVYMLNTTGASTFTNTSISNNTGPGSGAGIYFNSTAAASLTLNGCTVNNNTVTNTASYDGGGLYLSGASISVVISGGTISGNSTRNGGGIYSASGSLSISGTAISSNTASANGGGLYINGSTTLSKCFISGNRAAGTTGGGGIRLVGATATITNCIITGNVSDGTNADGGGMSNGGTAYIYNSSISGNYTTRYGGGLYGAGTVSNSIIWGNTSGGSLTYYNIYGSPTVSYSDIGPSQNTYEGSNGNINQPPQFINLQQASSGNPTTAGNFHLCYASGVPDPACAALSPCIDTASATNAPADDIDADNVRPTDIPGVGDSVDDYDMGADEYMP